MPTDYNLVLEKVKKFIQKYYVNELIKGFLIFSAIGLVYILSLLLLENFLWMSTTVRLIMFWSFILISFYLFIRFIGLPLAKLVNIGNQISPIQASEIIGSHFPEIDDQLINLIQLKSKGVNSDLLEASIAQKSKQLSPLPFSKAINFKKSFSYSKYVLIPVLFFLLFSVFKGFDWYKSSLSRVVNYDVAYTAPAPFYFNIKNPDLNALQNNDFTLEVMTEGKSLPSQIKINFNNESYFLKKTDFNKFQHTFKSVQNPIEFKLSSGTVFSSSYILKVNDVPSISDFSLHVTAPKHTLKKEMIINNSGNAIVPEGSKLSWNIKSSNADVINISYNDSVYSFDNKKPLFLYKKRIADDFNYMITSSNEFIQNHEKLNFNIEVVKDQFPLINVLTKTDSIVKNRSLYYGRVSDDYGLRKVNLVYYNTKSPDIKQKKGITISKGLSSEFTYQFPNDLNLEEAANYAFYFQVYDNDTFNNYKSSKSKTFNYNVVSKIEKQQIESQSQQQQLDDFQNTIEKFENSKLDLESFSKLQKQSLSLSFKEKEKLSSLLEKQFKEQKKLKKLANNLEKALENVDKKDNLTKEELERTKKQLEQNKKLIEEIKKAVEKLSPKELKDKVDELKKENKKVTKNLSQILDLTKRYYVIDKHQRIVQMLELLSEKQIDIATKSSTVEIEEQIKKEYKIIREELDDLREHNSKLRKPMALDDDSVYEGKIESKIIEAIENLKKSKTELAKSKQNVAGVMLKNLANKMSKTSAASGGEQLKDDEESLRQILDNLVLFSIEQEDNMNNFSNISNNNPNYSKYIRIQNQLREHFKHIDDSLYAVSSRNPKIGTKVNDLISDIDYNLDSSLESIADNRAYQGVTKLRFAISNSNDLAVMLSQSLKQINQRMKPGKGKPKDQGFQLPDIIKKQESLNKAFQEALQAGQKKPGDSTKEGSGGKKKPGESGKEGQEGKQGEQGNSGKQGKGGDKGDSGEQVKGGKRGKAGQSGENGESGEDGSFGLGKGSGGKGKGDPSGEESTGEGENSDGKSSKKGNGKGSQGESGDGGKKSGDSKDSNNGKEQSSDGKFNRSDNPKDSNSNIKGNSSQGKKGKSGGGNDGNAIDNEENDYQQLFEIYKQQQDLRNQLEDRIAKEGIQPNKQSRVLNLMKQVENDLIEKGFNEETLNRMLNLKHQLFKLDKAQFQQEKDKNRKSKNSTKSFVSDKVITPEQIKKYFNSTEILNREALPLKPNYKRKVNSYFTN